MTIPPPAALSSADSPALLDLNEINVVFGSTRVLQDVSLRVNHAEVVGLVGDNGAGKSTLVKVITGYYRPTSGRILMEGQPVSLTSPTDARRLGIETVYQDLALVDEMSLWRNFFLGKEVVRFGRPPALLNTSAMRTICRDAISELGLTRVTSVDVTAGALSGGERQSIAITRAMHFGARLLLLDEPTAALSVRETRHVLNAIDQARSRGLGVIYIDHNMAHVQPVADRLVVLHHGRVALSMEKGSTTIQELDEMLVQLARGPAASEGIAS